jgi:hypothetical protein
MSFPPSRASWARSHETARPGLRQRPGPLCTNSLELPQTREAGRNSARRAMRLTRGTSRKKIGSTARSSFSVDPAEIAESSFSLQKPTMPQIQTSASTELRLLVPGAANDHFLPFPSTVPYVLLASICKILIYSCICFQPHGSRPGQAPHPLAADAHGSRRSPRCTVARRRERVVR